jgi:hypothetical protein
MQLEQPGHGFVPGSGMQRVEEKSTGDCLLALNACVSLSVARDPVRMLHVLIAILHYKYFSNQRKMRSW